MKQSFLALPLAVEPGVGIGGRGMRIVRPLLAMEIGFLIASLSRGRAPRLLIAPAASWWLTRTVLGLDALHRRPRLDQRAVDREVIARQKPLDPGLRQHRAQELRRDVAFQQPVAALGEHRMIPRSVIDADADEPAEQKVVFQPLHQEPFRTDRVERLAEHRPQQLLRRDRRPPDRRIERRELTLQRAERLVHDRPDRPQRMIAPNPSLQIDITEKFASSVVSAAHASVSESLRRQ